MIPCWQEPFVQIGHTVLYSFGILLVAATVLGVLIFVRRAEKLFKRGRRACYILVVAVPVMYLGAHLMYCVFDDRTAFLKFTGISSFGAILSGAMVLGLFAVIYRRRNDPFLSWFDVASYAGVFAAIVARVGCFLSHDHLGLRTSFWISVNCFDGPRYDLSLIEVIFLVILAIVLMRIKPGPWGWAEGVVFGISALSYGIFRFGLEFFRDQAMRYNGLTAEQWAALILVGSSLFAFLVPRSKSAVEPIQQ
jgi:phosphatidylglycerol---prolipoprotein diacylglyceryl transferase